MKNFIILVWLIILISCDNANNNKTEKKLHFSSKISEFSLNDSIYFFKSINNFKVKNEKIFIITNNPASCFIFDLKKNSITKIFGLEGKGAENLLFPTDVLLSKNDHIFICDRDLKSVKEFDMNGEFINSFKVDFAPAFIQEINDNLVITPLINDESYALYVYDKNGTLIDKEIDLKKRYKRFNMVTSPIIEKFKDNILLAYSCGYNGFQVYDADLKISYNNLAENNLPSPKLFGRIFGVLKTTCDFTTTQKGIYLLAGGGYPEEFVVKNKNYQVIKYFDKKYNMKVNYRIINKENIRDYYYYIEVKDDKFYLVGNEPEIYIFEEGNSEKI